MQEELLHFVWQHRNFNQVALKTTGSLPIKVIKSGQYNTNAGPDFLNAQIQIGETLWAGNVEIHVKSSHWIQHGHSKDKSYDNVVLHVVYEDDTPISDKPLMPVLELKAYIDPEVIADYNLMKSGVQWLPCESFLGNVDDFVKDVWLNRMLAERLERKSEAIGLLLSELRNDWAEAAYVLTGRNFGFKVNSDSFEQLCKSLKQKIPAKHKNSLLQIEALFFGQAGMLNSVPPEDEYIISLKKEYQYLSSKYKLSPLENNRWKFLRMRPVNFPTYRIAQFAQLIYKSEHLFSRILEIKDLKSAYELFDVSASKYWESHYKFDTFSSNPGSRKLGRDAQNNILINTIVPLLFAYGHYRDQPVYKETALKLMDEIKSENNNILREWVSRGMKNDNAFHSQALLHLKKEYCDNRRCLSCGIGTNILRNASFKSHVPVIPLESAMVN